MKRWSAPLLVALMAVAPVSAHADPAWTREDANELLSVVDQIDREGLDPDDYDPAALRRELAAPEQAWAARATRTFIHLASDLHQGHVRNRASLRWYIAGPTLSETEALSLLDEAVARHAVRQTLQALAPRQRQYALLKDALAATPPQDKERVRRIRANLERWRWMPRDLGSRYLLVNVPEFTVTHIEKGAIASRRRVIVGKPTTPTPQFSAIVSGAIFNPWWDVPDSIVRESVGRLVRRQPALARSRGYVVSGGRYRQRPGPGNALGLIKLVMPNPYRTYLHDTPSKALFDDSVRAFSHGCIRTQDAIGLAEELLAGTPNWDRPGIDRAIAAGGTVQADLARPLPIYVAYFTAVANEDGTLSQFADVYKRDAAIVAQLVDRELN